MMTAFGSVRSRPRGLRRVLRAAIISLLVIVLLPYLLTPLYLVVTPVSTPMLWRYATGQRVVRSQVPIANIAPILPLSVIVAEDSRFCTHSGVDWDSLRQVIEEADDGEDLRGGSTITQQLAKNLFLWQGRSYVRKALEMPLSIWIDLILPKQRIMELYLNIAEWGPNGEFGAQAGARYAFNAPVRNLSPRQAALLAAILPNPVARSARRPGPGVRRLAGIYERRAYAGGGLDNCLRGRTSAGASPAAIGRVAAAGAALSADSAGDPPSLAGRLPI